MPHSKRFSPTSTPLPCPFSLSQYLLPSPRAPSSVDCARGQGVDPFGHGVEGEGMVEDLEPVRHAGELQEWGVKEGKGDVKRGGEGGKHMERWASAPHSDTRSSQ
jgi:hypothetical protein